MEPGIRLFVDGEPLLKERGKPRPFGLNLANTAGLVRNDQKRRESLIFGGGNLTSRSKGSRHHSLLFVYALLAQSL
jgi:hypothetical protein